MKNFFSLLISFFALSLLFTDSTRANGYYHSYDPYRATTNTLCHFSSASVGVGTLPHGVVVTIDSADYATSHCIKNTSWVSYFSSYGNTVNVSASNTTLGVQIVATSMDDSVSARLKNTQWSDLMTGRPTTYITPTYTQPRISRNINRRVYRGVETQYVNYHPQYVEYPQGYYPTGNYYPIGNYYPTQPHVYIPPVRTYIAGSSLWNTSQVSRYLSYQSNGIRMTLSSPDYGVMRYLQTYHYAGLFRDFSGISISLSNIPGGIEVTVTAGNTNTIEQIQRIGHALVYN